MTNYHIPIKYKLPIFCTLLAASQSIYADNYMRSEGEGYYTSSFQYDTAHYRWDQNDNRVQMPCTAHNWALTQSYEYGLSYYNTVFGSVDYLDRSCGPYGASGVGNATLGLRRRFDIYRNGRSWEAAAIIPTGYRTTGQSTIGSGLYGLRLGVFGGFGGETDDSQGPVFELGANFIYWEGTAAKQLSGYAKYNFLYANDHHFYGALGGDYALINRNQNPNNTVNRVSDYGYDRLDAHLGYTTKMTLKWRVAIEGVHVLRGRYIDDSNSIKLTFSRRFLD